MLIKVGWGTKESAGARMLVSSTFFIFFLLISFFHLKLGSFSPWTTNILTILVLAQMVEYSDC